MATVDSIRPPKKAAKRPARKSTPKSAAKIPVTQAKPAPAKQTTPKPIPAKQVALPKASKPLAMLPSGDAELKKRKRLMWILVICTTVVIFLAWLFFFPTPSTTSRSDGYWAGVSQRLSDLWNTVKTDILRIRENARDVNVNSDEHIQQLENQVFPQFNDPTKQ